MARNVVLLTIDSLRADHCGYVSGGDLTPTLDGLADDGVAFTDALAPGPKTPESMPAIMTGRHQPRDVDVGGIDSWERIIRPQVGARRTLAERFDRRGYTTIGFSPNGFTSSYFGFDAGFDRFEDFLEHDVRPSKRVPGPLRGLLKWVRREGNWKQWEGYYDDVLESVQAAVDGSDEPYLLWVFLMDVHSPYLVPRSHRRDSWPGMVYANMRSEAVVESPSVRRRLRRTYEDAVGYADDCLSRLREDLPGDPVFCVHADHGEAFGEHGDYGHERHLYRENLHVPFVVGGVDVDRTVHRPVSLVALPRVLAGAATGGDALEAELSALATDRPAVAKSGEGGRIAVRSGRLKLVRSADGVELYDLVDDPDERRDRSTELSTASEVLERYADRHERGEREELRIRSCARDVVDSGA